MHETAYRIRCHVQQGGALVHAARALEQQRTQPEAVVLVAQHAEIGPAQQLHPRTALQPGIQVMPMRGALAPLPQQRAQRLARQRAAQFLVAAFGKPVQGQRFKLV